MSRQAKGDWEMPVSLPLVSIIVSNYNYGAFLRDAVESSLAQTYPNCECIVVDDCSTDDSPSVLEQLASEQPEVKIVALQKNAGQSGVVIEGLKKASGNYVLMLDADDLLLPECVAYHVALHLSTRRPVGFSCCNALQIVDKNIVTTQAYPFGISFPTFPIDANLLRSIDDNELVLSKFKFPAIRSEDVRHIPATFNGPWPWATTSCMFFRRDALDLISGAQEFQTIRICTDNYVARCINMLTGSVLLDKCLVAYRLHGSNNFVRRPPLDNLINFHRSEESSKLTYRVFLNDLISRFGHYYACFFGPERLVEIAEMMDSDPFLGESRLPSLLRQNRESLESELGAEFVENWINRLESSEEILAPVEGADMETPAPIEEEPSGFAAKMPWRLELEYAKFLCTIGLRKDSPFLWEHANRRRNAAEKPA